MRRAWEPRFIGSTFEDTHQPPSIGSGAIFGLTDPRKSKVRQNWFTSDWGFKSVSDLQVYPLERGAGGI